MLNCAVCKKPYENDTSSTCLSATWYYYHQSGKKFANVCYDCMVGEVMPTLEKKFKFKMKEIK